MNALLEHFVGLLDGLFSRIQSYTGVTGMAYVFVAPNMLVFSIFVLFPMLFNFVYTFTGSDRLFLDQRPYVGAANLERLFDCQDFLRPVTCDEDLFASAVLNTASFVVTQVAVMIAVSLLTAVVLNGKIRARGFFRSVFFYPVLLSPIVVAMIWRWMLQENGLFNALIVSLGGEKLRFLTDRNWARFWVVMVSVWSLMGFLYADSAGGLAGDTRRFVRGGCHRRRQQLARFPVDHFAYARADDAGGHRLVHDTRGADIRCGLRFHRRRTRLGDSVHRALHLQQRLRQPLPRIWLGGGDLPGHGDSADRADDHSNPRARHGLGRRRRRQAEKGRRTVARWRAGWLGARLAPQFAGAIARGAANPAGRVWALGWAGSSTQRGGRLFSPMATCCWAWSSCLVPCCGW